MATRITFDWKKMAESSYDNNVKKSVVQSKNTDNSGKREYLYPTEREATRATSGAATGTAATPSSVKPVHTPVLDAATGNKEQTFEDVIASFGNGGSSYGGFGKNKSASSKKDEAEILGTVGTYTGDPNDLAKNDWAKAGVKNAEEYRKYLNDKFDKGVDDTRFALETRIPMTVEAGATSALADAVSGAGTAAQFLGNVGNRIVGRTPVEDALASILNKKADSLYQSAQDARDLARQDSGNIGNLLMNAGEAGTQMAGDILAGGIAGVSSMVPMVVRAFGGGAKQAKDKGYNTNQQMALGITSAATEYFTEKMFGGNPLYDSDAGLVNKAIKYIGGSDELMSFLSSKPVETINESLEEITSDILNPLWELIITGKADWPTVKEMIDDGIVGMMLGGAGQVAGAVANKGNSQQGISSDMNADTASQTSVQERQAVTPEDTARTSTENAQQGNEQTDNIRDTASRSQQQTQEAAQNPIVLQAVENANAQNEAMQNAPDQNPIVQAINENASDNEQASNRSGMTGNNNGYSYEIFLDEDGNEGDYIVEVYTPDGRTISINTTMPETDAKNIIIDDIAKNQNPTVQNVAPIDENRQKADSGNNAPAAMSSTVEAQNEAPVALNEPTRQSSLNLPVEPASNYGNSVGAATPAVDVEAPTRAKPLTESNVLSDEAVEEARQNIPTHRRVSDARSIGEASAMFTVDSNGRITNARDVAMDLLNMEEGSWTGVDSDGAMMAAQALWDDGSRDAFDLIVSRYAKENSIKGQALRAAQKWIKSPPAKLAVIQKAIEDHCRKLGIETIELSQEVVDEFLNAKDDKTRNAVIKKMQTEVASQLPSTLMDKWTALRYVNMLGNFRTQIRNVVGNTAMIVNTTAKNAVRSMVESITPGLKKTSDFFVKKKLLDSAKKYYEAVKEIALGSKYNDSNAQGFIRGAEDLKGIFVSDNKVINAILKPLELYRKGTNWAMESGDVIFSKSVFAPSLAGYLQAHGMNAEMFNGIVDGTISPTKAQESLIREATDFAINEAQEATFRDTNAVSDFVSKSFRGKDTPKAVRMFGEGLMPFRKTPANILVRAEEYSPLGFLNTTVKTIQSAKGKNNVTSSDVVNSLAKSITGSGIFALGMLLAAKGRIKGKSDDEKQEDFNDLRGQQNYAFYLDDGTSVTIDWLSPGSAILFMGTQLWELAHEEGLQGKDFEEALSSITDPLIEMSMLQGLRDTLDNVKYAENNLVQTAMTTIFSYLTQGITNTLIGQVKRSLKDERMSTYRDKNSELPTWMQSIIGKTSTKSLIPEYNQVEFIDAWGRTEDNGNKAESLLTNMLSPGYISKDSSTSVDDELQRLYDNGLTSVFPKQTSFSQEIKVFDENGENAGTRYMTKDEYVEYAKLKGQKSLELVKRITESYAYKDLSDEEKAKLISSAYSYADEIAQKQIESTTPSDYKNQSVANWERIAFEEDDANPYISAYVIRQMLNDDSRLSAQQKTNRFSQWVDENYIGKQAEGLKDVFGFNTNIRMDTVTYDKLTSAKISPASSNKIIDSIGLLDNNPYNWEKYTAIVSTGGISDDDIDKAISVYGSDKNAKMDFSQKYAECRKANFRSKDIVKFYEIYCTTESTKDENGKTISGSKKNNIISAAKEYGFNDSQATGLYNMFKDGSWEG